MSMTFIALGTVPIIVLAVLITLSKSTGGE